MPTTLPDSTDVGRVSLVVNDLETTLAFYRDVAGLPVLTRESGEARLGAGETVLLHLVEDEDAIERPRSSAGLYHVAFKVPSRTALGAALERVRSEWRLDGASDHLVSEALYLSDPEGNGVEIYRDRPKTEWPTTDDGHVGMDTLPLDLDDLANESDGDDACPPGTGIGHVHLEVSNLEETRAFYADALGLNVRQEFGGSALFLAAGDYHHHVGANTWQHRMEQAEGRGLDWFELVVPHRDAIEGVRSRLDEREFDVTSRGANIVVTDPDGMSVRVTAGD